MSQHVKKLEQNLGVSLFTRDSGRVIPTPVGDSYYHRCIEVLQAHENANRAVQTYAKGCGGEIVIGLMPTLTRCALAPVIETYMSLHPIAIFRAVECYSATLTLTEQVQNGLLDFAVVPAFPGAPGLKSSLFATTPELLAAGVRSAFGKGQPIRLKSVKNIKNIKLVLPSQANIRRRLLETHLVSNGIQVERVFELDVMMGALDLVARSDWVTILPGVMMAGEAGDSNFIVSPIVDPVPCLDLVLIQRARILLSEIAEAFLNLLRQETLRLNSRWQQ